MDTDSEALLHAGERPREGDLARVPREARLVHGRRRRIVTHQVGVAHKRLLFETLGLDHERDFTIGETLGNVARCPARDPHLAEREGFIAPGHRVALQGIGVDSTPDARARVVISGAHRGYAFSPQVVLDCVVLEVGRPADAAVIWLHGLGASGHDFPPVVAELGLPEDHAVRFVFPHAPRIPVTINGGMVMPAWYDILNMDFDQRRVDEDGVRASAARLEDLVAREPSAGSPRPASCSRDSARAASIALHAGLR